LNKPTYMVEEDWLHIVTINYFFRDCDNYFFFWGICDN